MFVIPFLVCLLKFDMKCLELGSIEIALLNFDLKNLELFSVDLAPLVAFSDFFARSQSGAHLKILSFEIVRFIHP